MVLIIGRVFSFQCKYLIHGYPRYLSLSLLFSKTIKTGYHLLERRRTESMATIPDLQMDFSDRCFECRDSVRQSKTTSYLSFASLYVSTANFILIKSASNIGDCDQGKLV